MGSSRGTIVYTKGGGRLGNQLINYANLLAFQLEHPEFEVFDLAFVPYIDAYGRDDLELVDLSDLEFDGFWKPFVRIFWEWERLASIRDFYPINRFRHQALHYFAQRQRNAQSIVGGKPHALFDIPGEQYDEFDLTDEANVDRLRSKDMTLLAGWGVRCWPLVSKYLPTIRTRLQPGEEHRSVAESFIEPLREKHDKLVGVLIRQGDYRTWNDGKYFFESRRYKELMEAYAAEFPSQDVGFVIASDERQNADLFADDSFTFATGEAVGPGHYVENFTELSLCDEVLTPPSTFSVFAAILGECPVVPLYPGVEQDGFDRADDPLRDSRDHPILGQIVK
ncbi:hypothetical protein [Haloplanus halobius]|uniref:hypothetical protein n=1 Tax=Haloplanus halobius TaxID=2934938 RepID=UPI002010A010|nr:hypothetical protein [Haloplanus sp. XH21]